MMISLIHNIDTHTLDVLYQRVLEYLVEEKIDNKKVVNKLKIPKNIFYFQIIITFSVLQDDKVIT